MRGAIIYAPGDVRVEEREDPKIEQPADAVIRLAATCVCGSDLWPYRGIEPVDRARPRWATSTSASSRRSAARSGPSSPASSSSARSSPPTTPARSARPATRAAASHREPIGADGTQAEYCAVPLADGTLVATPGLPADDLIPSLLAASDVLGTGWFGAVAADVQPGKTVAVVGDGAVGLLAVLAARQLGAERIIAMSRHEPRQKLAAGVRRDRHRHRARRRGRRADQGAHRRARRALGHRGRRHPGVDDAGHPLDPPRRPRRLRRRRPRRRAARRGAVLQPRSTCTAAPPRSAASCPT